MYKLLLLSSLLFFIGCNSSGNHKHNEAKEKDSAPNENRPMQTGVPAKEEARAIVQDWFDSFKELVGGTSYEADKFDVLSVSGDAQRAYINFQWTGTIYPASIPNTDRTPVKVEGEKKTLLVSKQDGKWKVDEVR